MKEVKIFGLCNDDPKAESFLGVFKKQDSGNYILCYDGKPNLSRVKGGGDDGFIITVDSWCWDEGLRISIGEGYSRFTTGIHAGYQGGSSGTIKNSEELLKFLKQNT